MTKHQDDQVIVRKYNQGPGTELVQAGAFALEFAVELAFGLAEFAGEALEGFFFVDAGFGLEAGDASGDGLPGLRFQTWGTRTFGRSFDEQDEFAADAVAGGELLANIGDGAAQEFFVDLGEFAGDDYAQSGPKTDSRSASVSRMRCGAS